MIKLDTPIIIYPNEYNAQFFVSTEVELRNQTMTLSLGPAQATESSIYLGVKETVGGQEQIRFPQLLRSVTIQQNLQNPDPVITDLFNAYVAFLQKAEQIVVANQHEPGGLAEVPYQNGTTEWSLESTWEDNGERVVGVEDIGARSAPEVAARKRG